MYKAPTIHLANITLFMIKYLQRVEKECIKLS